MRAGGCSDRGPVRRTNEDALFKDEDLGLLIVADGMGGHAAGEVASRLAIEAVSGFIRRTSEDQEHSWPYGIDSGLTFNANRLRTAVHLANRRVFREAENHDDYTGMGTTIVAALVLDGTSRSRTSATAACIYAANGQLVQLTRDDSWAATVLGQRPLGAQAAEQHPMRHVLTNVLGARDNTEIHIQERQVAPSDILLLCTDGLHGSLDDAAIQAAAGGARRRWNGPRKRWCGRRSSAAAATTSPRWSRSARSDHDSGGKHLVRRDRSASDATGSSTGSAAARWESSTRRTTS